MKRIIFLTVAIIGLLAAGCKKDNKNVINGVSAIKNFANWSTTNVNTGFKPLATKDTLFIVAQNGEEDIVLAIKQHGAGVYQPGEFKAYFYTTVGFDAIVSNYKLANNPANSINITGYDEVAHTVKVTFNLDFINTYKNSSSYPDEITFTNGKVDTQLSYVFMDPIK